MENYENNENYEISIKDLFKTFKQGFWIIIITAVVFAVAAFGFSKIFMQKTYTSSVKLYVETTTKGDNAYNDLSSYNYAKSLVNTYIEMLQTNNFYEKLSNNLDNKYTSSELSSMVTFSNDTEIETEVFNASITANSPTEAKIIADSVASVAPGVISTLNDNADLKIVDNATIPTSPSSPNVTKNTLLAFVAGFLLALIYVFVKEALDNKIKYNSDMIEICNIPILSAIPDFYNQKISLSEYFAPSNDDNDYKSHKSHKEDK